MAPRYLVVIFAAVLFFLADLPGTSNSKADPGSGRTTTVILIRHAERDNFFMLTDVGLKHARALIDAVDGMGISKIFSPDLERNLGTVRPLANHLGIEVKLIPRITPQTIDEIVDKVVERNRGEVVLMVGNGSGNLRALHQRLGGEGDGPYQYGDLFIYNIPTDGPAQVIRSRF